MPSINTSDITRASDSTYFVDIARVTKYITYLLNAVHCSYAQTRIKRSLQIIRCQNAAVLRVDPPKVHQMFTPLLSKQTRPVENGGEGAATLRSTQNGPPVLMLADVGPFGLGPCARVARGRRFNLPMARN